MTIECPGCHAHVEPVYNNLDVKAHLRHDVRVEQIKGSIAVPLRVTVKLYCQVCGADVASSSAAVTIPLNY